MENLALTGVRCAWSRAALVDDDSDEIVEGVSFSVKPGMWYALVGDNGIGKSTLLHAIAGSCAHMAGTVHLLGRTIEPGMIRQRFDLGLQFVPQEVLCTANWRWSDVETAALRHRPGLAMRTAIRDMYENIRDGGILSSDEALMPPRLARLLISILSCPSVLLLDEIGTIFSHSQGEEIYKVIRRLVPESSVIFVEHDVRIAEKAADNVGEFIAVDLENESKPRIQFRQRESRIDLSSNSSYTESPQVHQTAKYLRSEESAASHLALARRAGILSRRQTDAILGQAVKRWPYIASSKKVAHFSGGMKVILDVVMDIVVCEDVDLSDARIRHVHQRNRDALRSLAAQRRGS